MSNNYDLGSDSDMGRFIDDLRNDIIDSAEDEIRKRRYDLDCPSCGKPFKGRAGRNTRPHCGELINLKLDIKFEP